MGNKTKARHSAAEINVVAETMRAVSSAGRAATTRYMSIPSISTQKRTHSDQQVAQIAASIREFGFTNPVLIDEEDGIIAGDGRVRGAHLLGLDEVPCIVLAHLTPAQRRPMCSPTTSWRSTPAGISRCSRSKFASWAERSLTSGSPA